MLLEELTIKDSIKYHKNLSSDIWTESDTLRKDVRSALDNIATAFIDTLGVEPDAVVDIIITGSICNYNYTKYSDIDLHIVVNYSHLCDDCVKFSIADCMDAMRSLWNLRHDITIFGMDVELYVHDTTDKITGNAGVYSVQNDKWLRFPKRERDIKFDEKIIKQKAETLMNHIDAVIEDGTNDELDKLREKIQNMRKAGLEKYGEFSSENLAFKILRNHGYMDKLYDSKQKLDSEKLSLK